MNLKDQLARSHLRRLWHLVHPPDLQYQLDPGYPTLPQVPQIREVP
jgi:hypothetical protein